MTKLRVLAVLVAVGLFGCAASDAIDTGVSTAQFGDVPVPDGLELQSSDYRSHSLAAGDFRQAHFEYQGSTPVAVAASYLRERMPLEGWTQTAEGVETASFAQLQFGRGPYRCECVLRRVDSMTRLSIDYTTESQ